MGKKKVWEGQFLLTIVLKQKEDDQKFIVTTVYGPNQKGKKKKN